MGFNSGFKGLNEALPRPAFVSVNSMRGFK